MITLPYQFALGKQPQINNAISIMLFSLQQYTRLENVTSLTVPENVKSSQNCRDEEIPTLFQEQKSTSMFSGISGSYSTPSAEGEKISKIG